MTTTTGYERYSPGDLLPDVSDGVTRRYAMVGDTYLTPTEIGVRADALWAGGYAIGKPAGSPRSSPGCD